MSGTEQTLKIHGLRSTLFRTQVLDIFRQSHYALSLADIEENLENFDRITLYRTLKSFEEKGLIHKISDTTGIPKYASCEESCSEDHHHHEHVHFHCEKCLKSFCIDVAAVPSVIIPEGYRVMSKEMLLKGICKDCSKN
jgi:Fur family ferric uptake transcriptional regulator